MQMWKERENGGKEWRGTDPQIWPINRIWLHKSLTALDYKKQNSCDETTLMDDFWPVDGVYSCAEND